MTGRDEELDYRTVTDLGSFTDVKQEITPQQIADEVHLGSLKQVADRLHDDLEGLYRDFNAFDVPSHLTLQDASLVTLRQIEARRCAYDILLPSVEFVDNAIRAVDSNYRKEEVS